MMVKSKGNKLCNDDIYAFLKRENDSGENFGTTEKESGFITLTTRTILELKPYLTAVYKDIIAVCQLCNEIVLQGVFCEDCGLKLHNHCRQKLLKRTSQCPGCSVRASNPFGEGTSAG